MSKRVYRTDPEMGGTKVTHTVRDEDRNFWHKQVEDDGAEPGVDWMTYPEAVESTVCNKGVDHGAVDNSGNGRDSGNEGGSEEGNSSVDLTPLTDISGIGPTIAQALVDEFGTVAAVFLASQAELQAVPGISLTIALAILAV